MTRPGIGFRFSALLCAACAVVACGGDDGGPSDPAETGSIQVTAMTTGADLDADGYSATVDGGSSRSITSDGTTTFSGVPAGQHQVTLSGLAANCSVTGDNPVAASVSGGATASVSFQVVCNALTGFIQVSTSTSGDDLDPDGYTAALDGGPDRSIGLNGVTTFSDVTVGQHQVELTGIADNCSVTGANPAGAAVAAGETAQVSFAVACDPIPVGSLEVTTTVTNNFDPDGYEVAVANVVRGSVDVDRSAVLDALPAGMQQVELRDIAPNCEVDGDNPATVNIPVGGVGTHTFGITCTSPPDGRIVHMGEVSGVYGLVVRNADGSGPLLVWECPTTCRAPRWSPDGSRIAFSMWNGSDADPIVDIYTVGRDGSDLRQLTDLGDYADHPAWSPDGSRIAFHFHDNTCCDFQSRLYVMNADGTGLAEIPRDAPMHREENPDWSPDGGQIVFAAVDEGYLNSGIFTISSSGGAATRITEPPPICDTSGQDAWADGLNYARTRWSPDGMKILFGRAYLCPSQSLEGRVLLTMQPDGSELMDLTDGSGWAIFPSWSPDGSRIVFDDGGNTVYVINSDGTGLTAITGSGGEPDWGP